MKDLWKRLRSVPGIAWALLLLGVLVLYPAFPFVDKMVPSVGLEKALPRMFIFGILALALNLQVGYAGLLQLGIAAFFGVGAYTAGVLTVDKYPFQLGFWGAIAVVPVVAGLFGAALAAPTIRLRGDYLAIVTLGFGEVLRVVILKLENITDGPRGLNPLPPPWLPSWAQQQVGSSAIYYLALGILIALVVVFDVLERSRAGRQLVALREDELVSACMGIDPARTKLLAFSAGAAIAGLAGALYATNLTTTAEPSTYDFNVSIIVLCCLLIGGLGSLRGALLGAFVLKVFDDILAPQITSRLQKLSGGGSSSELLDFNKWRWMIFGTALVLMMRFRPEGLWPSSRVKEELHHTEEGP